MYSRKGKKHMQKNKIGAVEVFGDQRMVKIKATRKAANGTTRKIRIKIKRKTKL